MKAKKVLSLLLCIAALTGCSTKEVPTTPTTESKIQTTEDTTTQSTAFTVSPTDVFTDRDKEVGYDENNCTQISFDTNGITASDDTVTVSKEGVTITKEGTYLIRGSMEQGRIIVDANKTAKVQLVLKDLTLSHASSAPIYVKQADKVFLTLASNSQNTLSTTGAYVQTDDNNLDAVIFSKEDLTINGDGTLVIKNAFGNGITSKDSLICTGGTYDIAVTGHGLEGKDCIGISSGTYTITSEKDGLHSENTEDTSLGYIYLAGGNYTITAQTDGIDASNFIQIDDGTYQIITGGGSQNASTKENGEFQKDWGKWGEAEPTTSEATTDSATPSAKGIKANDLVTINSGTLNIDSSDDSIHTNNDVSIQGGILTLTSGDDGIHGDSNVTIQNGAISITKSYEGIEAQSIDITGGDIKLLASDDGINAGGGNDSSSMDDRPGQGTFATDENAYIKISGGTILVNASGDGVDSNGNLYVSGGTTYVSGPENNGNGALDYNGSAQITGGVFVASGSSGMAMNFGDTSTQGSILVNTQATQTGAITLFDGADKELINYTPDKTYNSVVISTPEITTGTTYTIRLGSDSQTIEMTELLYGTGSQMGQPGGTEKGDKGGGGMGKGNRGEKPDQNGQPPEPPTAQSTTQETTS